MNMEVVIIQRRELKRWTEHSTDLEVEMDDLLMVHVGDALQDLLHEAHARALSQHELVLDHPIEELSTADAGKNFEINHQNPSTASYMERLGKDNF